MPKVAIVITTLPQYYDWEPWTDRKRPDNARVVEVPERTVARWELTAAMAMRMQEELARVHVGGDPPTEQAEIALLGTMAAEKVLSDPLSHFLSSALGSLCSMMLLVMAGRLGIWSAGVSVLRLLTVYVSGMMLSATAVASLVKLLRHRATFRFNRSDLRIGL